MKNREIIETPLANIERNPLMLTVLVIISVILGYFTWQLFAAISGWAFMLMIPAAIIGFQTLWFLLNPFAMVFDNRIEIRHNMLQEKRFYFTDVKDIAKSDKGHYFITYTDDETERLNLLGIRKSDLQKLVDEFLRRKAVS